MTNLGLQICNSWIDHLVQRFISLSEGSCGMTKLFPAIHVYTDTKETLSN
jgi:hypothetical protein